MYINKLIKKQVMLILATVVLVGTLAVTTSFAVFEETKSNATDQKMTIGNLDVTYTGGATNTYNLRLWVADASTYRLPNSALGQEIHLKIFVEGKAGSGWTPSNPLLKDLILTNNKVQTPITTPGAAVSTADEALLASAEDDYGTSYYFRGAVTNNYVEFANKCWRIVRIVGDGSVKLVLHNDNTAGAANPCSSANNSTNAAFARYSGEKYTSKFNTNYDDNAYVGFKYGTPGSSTHAATHANTNKSTILNNLETWYNTNLKTYESVIANTVWCNDKTNVTDTTYNPEFGDTPTGLGYGTNRTYYGATQRLIRGGKYGGIAGGTGPSLKCNGELSKITSKVGLITADELALAGCTYAKKNTTTYLQENATDTPWWSLSPDYFTGSDAYVWNVIDGSLIGFNVGNTYGVRPSISLKPTTNVTGEGTSSSPFIISM